MPNFNLSGHDGSTMRKKNLKEYDSWHLKNYVCTKNIKVFKKYV